jgi:hypothetical protein
LAVRESVFAVFIDDFCAVHRCIYKEWAKNIQSRSLRRADRIAATPSAPNRLVITS